MARPRILCAGIATLDHVFRVSDFPPRGGKSRATAFARVGGGMAANAAVAAARLGAEVEFWSQVPADAAGDEILAGLAAEGVETTRVVRGPGESVVSAILVEPSGERTVCARVDDAHLDADPALPWDSVGAFDAVLSDCRFPRIAVRLLQAAAAAGRPSVLDVEPMPQERLAPLLALATHAFFSEPGLRAAAGDGEHVARLRRARGAHRCAVGVTLGAKGAAWLDADGHPGQCPAPAVEAVDTLGAGDAFHGALAVALAEGRALADAVRFACIAAALKCRRFGGRAGAPSRAEVDALF